MSTRRRWISRDLENQYTLFCWNAIYPAESVRLYVKNTPFASIFVTLCHKCLQKEIFIGRKSQKEGGNHNACWNCYG